MSDIFVVGTIIALVFFVLMYFMERDNIKLRKRISELEGCE